MASAAVLSGSTTFAEAAPKPFSAGSGTGRVFGLSAAGPDAGLVAAQNSAATVGRHLDVVNSFSAWQWRKPLPTKQLREISASGATPEITWEPWDPRQGVDQPGYSLAAIASGQYDSYIRSWATSAASYRLPILLRFGHEMNGSWYPWSTSRNHGSAAGYIAAYRHVHDVFAGAGAVNVRWVYSPATTSHPADAYPGAAYVDIIALDGYNGGTDVPSLGGWKTPAQIFDATLAAISPISLGKPIWINETASSEHGGDKAAWIGNLVSYLKQKGIVGLIWFDIAKETDWRLASTNSANASAASALRTW